MPFKTGSGPRFQRPLFYLAFISVFFWTSIWAAGTQVWPLLVLLTFCWIFVGFVVPAGGPRGSQTLRWAGFPAIAFSNIRKKAKGFV